MRHFTEDEIVDFAKWARKTGYVVRWIEFMPLDADGNWERDRVLSGAEIKAIIERDFMPLVPDRCRGLVDLAAVPVRGRHRRDRLHQPGQRAVLRHLQPDPPDRRRPASDLPLLDRRVGPARAAALRRHGPRACGHLPRSGRPQREEAPDQRGRAVPARLAEHVPDRRLTSRPPLLQPPLDFFPGDGGARIGEVLRPSSVKLGLLLVGQLKRCFLLRLGEAIPPRKLFQGVLL